MKHNKELMLGVGIMTVFLLSSVMCPAAAAQAVITEEQFERSYAPNANNHTYVYSEPDLLSGITTSMLHVDQDLHMRRYAFDGGGWTYYDAAYSGPDDVPFSWSSFNVWAGTAFANTSILPCFTTAVAADGGPAVLNTTLTRSSFQLKVGQVSTVVLEPSFWYYGVLGIAAEEFVHLSISSRQVYSTTWDVTVLDPEGRLMGSIEGTENASIVLPFRPAGPGTYIVMIFSEAASQGLFIFDLLAQAVAPRQVAFGELVQDVLEDGEFVVTSDSGSVVDTKKAPTAHTYKFYSDEVALISYSFNYPGVSVPVEPPIQVRLEISSDAFMPLLDYGQRYLDVVNSPQGNIIYYRSSNGEAYYVTVLGADNVQYTLFHESNVAQDLPVNQEFLVTNYQSYAVRSAYSLNLAEDSFMKLNSSASAVDYDWTAWAVYGNDMYIAQDFQWQTTLQSSQFYYLPAGHYVFQVTTEADTSEQFEFSIGPVYEGPTAEISRVGGFRVDSNTMTYYNATFKLLNQDNITVRTHMTFYDRYMVSVHTENPILANRWDGSHWLPHPTYDNYTSFLTTSILTEDYCLVAVCTYKVSNNTETATNDYTNYPVQYGIESVDFTNDYFNGSVSLEVGTAAVAHNFTLSLPGEATEYYQVGLSVPKGVWFNVTIIAEDVSTFTAILLQNWQSRTHRTPWNDLNDELVGSIGTELSFQFGSISDSMTLILNIGRGLAVNGSLYVKIEPFNVSVHTSLPRLAAQQPDFLAGLLVYAVPIAIGAATIVIAAVVYVKKFKK